MAGTIVGAESGTATGGANITASVPAGRASGDVLVAIENTDWGLGTDAEMGPTSGAWTELGEWHHSGGDAANGIHVRIWGRTSDGTETSYTFNQGTDADGTATIVCLRGVTLEGLIVSGAFAASGTSSRVAPSLSGVGSGAVLLCGAMLDPGAATTWTQPTGMAELADVQSTTWTTTGIAGLAGPPNPSGTRTFTATGTQTGAGVVWSLALPQSGPTTITGTATAALGGLNATATGVVTRVSATANLGALTATATGVRSTKGAAAAALGGLTATATSVRETFASASAQLGGLLATAVGDLASYLGATGPALNPSVWLVGADGALAPLPQWQSLTISPVVNSPGSCELVIPAGAAAFAALHDGVSASPQRDQEIEVWPAGSPEHRSRWLLQQKSGDDLQPGNLWTFSGVGLEQLLAEVLVGPQATETQELVFADAVTYGTLLATVLQAAQARDDRLLAGVTWDFTTTTDSAGQPWANTLAGLKFAPDATLLDVAGVGPEEGVGEFAMGPDRVLRAYNFGTRGADRSGGAAPVKLAAAANLSEAARRESSRVGDAATAVLAKGAEGQYQWAADATAEAQRGRRVEVAADAGQLTSSGAVLAAAQGRLETLKTGVSERVHGVAFGNGLPIPGVDYDTGDWILSVTDNVPTRQRITQWTVTMVPGQRARGTVRTNDLVADRLVRLSRQLDGMKRGGVVVGTSSPSPTVDDGKAPAQVTGLAASSSAYTDADGATWAAVQAGWAAVVTNADGTAADDIDGYLIQYRYTGGDPMPAGWVDVPRVATPASDFDGLVAGQPLEVRAAAVDRYGHVGAWSSPVGITTGADATPPPTPSAPAASNYIGLLRVDWDGLGSAGESMPPDFAHIEVHASTSSGFTPNPALYPGGTLIGLMRGRGSFPWAPPTLSGEGAGAGYEQTWYVRLVAVDRNGNRQTAASAQDSAVTGKIEQGDVGSVNIGVLQAGIMNALMIVGDKIATGTTGSRVEIDGAAGLFCINDAEQVVLSYDIDAQVLQMLGRLTAGAGVGVGPTVVVEPAGTPGIRMYPTATQDRFEMVANTTQRPGGATAAGFGLHGRNASGQTNGLALEAWSTNVWLGQRRTDGSLVGGSLQLQQTGEAFLSSEDNDTWLMVGGGNVEVITPNATLNIAANGDVGIATPSSSVHVGGGITVQTEGEIRLDGGIGGGLQNAATLILGANGQADLWSGTTHKAFVIPHPTDSARWLVHACLEGPTADVIYRGEVEIVDGAATVELPSYFEAAALVEGRQVQLTPVGELCMVAASRIEGGRFTIRCSGPDGTRVAWLVTAVRADVAPFDVEPLRSEVQVGGIGPYRFIAPRREKPSAPRQANRGEVSLDLGER